jgi:peroxin-11B
MVADAVIYHPSVAHFLKYTSTTVGRDKLLRTVQYFARFYAWYLLRTNAVKSAIEPWVQTKKQLGLVRKFMRIGKNVEHLKAAAAAADAKGVADPVLKYTAVGRQLGYAGYLSLDSATVLDAAGIRKWQGAKRLQQEAYRFWAFGLTFSVVAQVYTLYRLKQREARVDKKDGEGVVESKRIALYVVSIPRTPPCRVRTNTSQRALRCQYPAPLRPLRSDGPSLRPRLVRLR